METLVETPPTPQDLLTAGKRPMSPEVTSSNLSASMGDSNPAWNSQAPDSTSFFQSRTIDLRDTVTGGNMSISPAGRDIALASRKGILIIDLDNPYEVPRFLPQGGWAEVADVQWNPHAACAEYIVSTSSEKLLIWNLFLSGRTSIQHVLHGHYRAITDVNWSNHHPNLIASCGIDSWIWTWDIRNPLKAVMGLCAWNPGATQVKWNRQDPHLLASSHDDRVLIWDDRKGSVPLAVIHAHRAKIYGIDWSRLNRDEIVTCSLDKTIKFWDIQKSSSAYDLPADGTVGFQDADQLHTPTVTIHTTSPVWRARYLPFGTGILSLPHRGKTKLEMWRPEQPDRPIEGFEGDAGSVVKEYVWRTKGGHDPAYDDREFQLISWSQDCHLRFWPISEDLLKNAGFEHGSPIKVPVLRRGANYESFRERAPQGPPAREEPPALSAPIGNRSILAGVRAGPPPKASGHPLRQSTTANAAPVSPTVTLTPNRHSWHHKHEVPSSPKPDPATNSPPPGPSSRSGFMTRGHTSSVSTRRGNLAMDQVTWWSSFKDTDNEITRFADRGREREMGTHRRDGSSSSDEIIHAETEVDPQITRDVSAAPSLSSSIRQSSQSRARGGQSDKDTSPKTLADEVASVAQKLASSALKVEKADFSKPDQRVCAFGIETPNGIFMRVVFTFPEDYPLGIKANTTHRAQVDIQKSPSIPLKRRAYILRELRKIRDKTQLCIEPCLRFLLGLPDPEGGACYQKPLVMDNWDSSGEEDQFSLITQGKDDYDPAIRKHQAPRPRTSQGVFSPNGAIVYLFPSGPPRIARGNTSTSRSPVPAGRLSFGSTPSVGLPSTATSQVFQNSGNLADALRGLSILARGSNSSDSDLPIDEETPPLHHLANYLPVRTDKWKLSAAQSREKASEALALRLLSKPRSSVTIDVDMVDYDAFDEELAKDFLITGESPDILCLRNAETARSHGRYDYERVFRLLHALVGNVARPLREGNEKPDVRIVQWGQNPLARRVVSQIYKDFCQRKNLQMLAMMAALLLEVDRLSLEMRKRKPAPDIVIRPPSIPIDYFSLRPKPPSPTHHYHPPIPSIINPSPAPWPKLPSLPPTPVVTQSPAPTTTKGSWSSMLYPRLLIGVTAISDGGDSGSTRTRTPSGPMDAPPTRASPDSAVPGAIPVPGGGRGFMGSPRSPRRRSLRQGGSAIESPAVTTKGLTPDGGPGIRTSFASSVASRRRTSLQQQRVIPQALIFPVPEKKVLVAFGGNKDEEMIPTHVPFVESHMLPQYAGHIEAYAEMLFRSNLMVKRAELLKLLPKSIINLREAQSPDFPVLTIAALCSCGAKIIGKVGENGRCTSCRKSPGRPKCSICRVRIRGLSRTCLECSHITHLKCWQNRDTIECPTGCGCICPKDTVFTVNPATMPTPRSPTSPIAPEYPPPMVTFKEMPQLRRVRVQ